MNAFLPVKPGVRAAKCLHKASTSTLGYNFKGLKCTLKMEALPFRSGGPAEKQKQTHFGFSKHALQLACNFKKTCTHEL